MRSWLRPRRVRVRLTLWYVAVLAGILVTYGAVTSTLLFLQLRSELDRLAIEDLETIEGFLSFDSNGRTTSTSRLPRSSVSPYNAASPDGGDR